MVETGKTHEEEIAELKRKLAEAEAKLSAAENKGPGAVAQDGSVAAGEKGLAVRSISPKAEQNIISGNNNLVANFINLHWPNDEEGREQDRENLRRQLASYLKWMLAEHGTIDLRGIKREGQKVVSLLLETVYVPLAAVYGSSQHNEFELDRILQQNKHSVVTGGPGCGKTTVLQHIAYTLCRALVDEQPELAEKKVGLQEEKKRIEVGKDRKEKVVGFDYISPRSVPLPIYVPLSLYDHYYKKLSPDAKAEKKTLAAFISHYLIERQASFDLPEAFFQTLLRHDHAVILLLDGLDEVPGEKERSRVRAAIEDLVKARENIRVMVTCRSAAYKERTAIGRGFSQIQVLPLKQSHLSDMVRHGYSAIHAGKPQKGKTDAENLLQSIDKLEEQRRQRSGDKFEPLVDSPLMVRLLLVVHYSERRLPEQRAELYEVAVMNMLYPNYGMDNQVHEHIGGLIGGSEKKHRDLAQYIAFQMHEKGSEQGREISEEGLREILSKNSDYAALCEDFIRLTRLRGTLMEERFGMYRFIHLAFQEFLVARYLAEVFRTEEKIVYFFQPSRIAESWWHEVVLLTVGYLSIKSSDAADKLIRQLAGLSNEPVTTKNNLLPGIQVALAGIAWSAVSEWTEAPASLKKDIPARFVEVFNNDTLFPNVRERVEAGNLLGKLGDPRFCADYWFLPDEYLLGFVEIPAGEFLMGDDKDERTKPQHMVLLERYFIGRYPVTVNQFRCFVTATGHTPANPRSLEGIANHPVSYVSWYDAMDYCAWLDHELRSSTKTPVTLVELLQEDWQVCLTSEAEWEKAARGDDGRVYPWGNRITSSMLANRGHNTSPVGCFPSETSPYGLHDCFGNVFEWTRSLWGKDWKRPEFIYPYDPADAGRENKNAGKNIARIVRGWNFIASTALTGRNGNLPVFGYNFRGFRVALVPQATSGL